MLALLLTGAVAHRHDAGCFDHLFMPTYHAALVAQVPQAKPINNEPVEAYEGETNFRNIRQLTFGGQNAEAYWSKDGRWIVYQSLQPEYPDEQIFMMRADGSQKRLMSTGVGRTTCSYLTPDNKYLYFSSTHEKNEGPQKKLDMSKGYVWMVNPQFSLYRMEVNRKQKEINLASSRPLTQEEVMRESRRQIWKPVLDRGGYIAETTIAPNGEYMTFTGNFEGDLEIYRANLDGTNIQKLTNEVGYDGGPFVSWDSKKIVYRRAPIQNDEHLKEYKELLAENLVRPGLLEIWIMDADGKNRRQVTNLKAASFAPFLHPDGKRIIFSSNYGDPKGREFDLWMIDVDGTNLKRITHSPDFDGFPMFSRDGKKLVWASNRNGKVRGETNIFVADFRG